MVEVVVVKLRGSNKYKLNMPVASSSPHTVTILIPHPRTISTMEKEQIYLFGFKGPG